MRKRRRSEIVHRHPVALAPGNYFGIAWAAERLVVGRSRRDVRTGILVVDRVTEEHRSLVLPDADGCRVTSYRGPFELGRRPGRVDRVCDLDAEGGAVATAAIVAASVDGDVDGTDVR